MRLGQSGCRGWWHSFGIVLTATALATGSAAAPGGPVPDPAARAAQQWEDLLLLEALRYLRMSPAQLGQMRPLAQRAEERLVRVREGSEAHWARLEQIAQQDREALLRGQKPSSKNQADGLLLRRTLEQQRAQAEEELVRSLVPAMQSILTRGQLQQVHGLFIGDPRWDGRSTPSPALADVTSGFVSAERAEVRRLRVGRVADLRHSSQEHAAAAAVATAQGQQMEAHENEEAWKSRAEEAAAIELQQIRERVGVFRHHARCSPAPVSRKPNDRGNARRPARLRTGGR